ncbi:odorant receptor 67c-like [Achroia grisella]|uniref:odorant receptor 67c-like n=1 Tax=Achroia grisella TaxID=688607 RepID=UPI0027D3198E|nr:odorant receptor 67c-like [Achroia grisella]
MGESYGPYQSNLTTKYFSKLCHIIFFWGLPNFWIEDLKLSRTLIISYTYFTRFVTALLYIFLILEYGAFFTQPSLSEKQSTDRLLFTFSHPLLFSYTFFMNRNMHKIKDLLYSLTVTLKTEYNYHNIEISMIRKGKLYCVGCIGICSMAMVMYGIDGATQYLNTGASFTTVITAWPDVNDTRQNAHMFRVVTYVIWWVFMFRVFSAYLLIIPINVCLSHQYIQLRTYFHSLAAIFEDNKLSPDKMDEKYEEGFVIGIGQHAMTIRCARHNQDVCSAIFVGQIMVNVQVLVLLMSQLVASERSLGTLFVAATTSVSLLFSTGFFMWNAGDVTVEASKLATAMYSSGWENCTRRCAVRVRKLLVLAMMQAQKPVIIRGMGVIEISYQSYLSIVKSSYSVFSVLY